jgi:oligoendopeptidase F
MAVDFSKVKTQWDLLLVMPGNSDAAVKADLEETARSCRKFITKWSARNDYLEDSATLKIALDEYELLQRDHGVSGRAGYYFLLRTCLDQNDTEMRAKYNQVSEQTLKIASELEFFESRLAKVDPTHQKKFLKTPELDQYRHWMEKLFTEGKYRLSELEERIMVLKSQTSYENWVKMTESFIASEELNGKNFSKLTASLSSKKAGLRAKAACGVSSILAKYAKTAEAEINSLLSDKKTNDELRGFTRADQSVHLDDDIESEVVDQMLAAVEEAYSISHDYYKLRSQLMGLPKIKYHERNVGIGKLDKKFSFEKSVKIENKTLEFLDPELTKIFKSFLYEGRIDAFSRKGKTNSEFCISSLKTLPTYILLNHEGKIDDMATLAHEMGHGIGDEFRKSSQNSLNQSVPYCLEEIASIFFEDFALDTISNTADEETKFALLIRRLDDAVNTVFRQTACYRFEQALHAGYRKKSFLSKDEVGKLFIKEMAAYGGPYVDVNDYENWWVHWSHIRTYFYVYTYVFGYLVSKFLQRKVRANPEAIKEVEEFFRAGSSVSPRDALKKMGVDIYNKEFWKQGLAEIREMLTQCRKQAVKLGKIHSK